MLAIILRHMATGATFRQFMYSFRVADNTISKFIPTVLEAIVDTFQAEVIPPLISSTPSGISPVLVVPWMASIFLSRPHQNLDHPNYKRFFSMILLALADADYKFIRVSVAKYGQSSDGQVFNDSELRELVERGELGH